MDKIIFVTPSIKTGGGNRVFFELANILCCDYSVEILYPNNNNEGNNFTVDSRIKVNKIGDFTVRKISKLFNVLKLFNYINKNCKNDFVIISDPIHCCFLNRIKNRKKLYRFIQADDYSIFDDKTIFKSNLFLFIYHFLCRKSYQLRINYFFNSTYTYERFVKFSGRKDVDNKMVYPAVNHEIFYNKNVRSMESFHLCCVGRKHKWKGLSTFIDALSILSPTIRGRISEIDIISHDDLSEMGISNEVVIIKPKNDQEISSIYNKASLFVSTSWWEGFGLPALEAMSCGCPTITSDNKGCREYAKDEINCLYFEPKNSKQLADKIELLVNSRDLRDKLAGQAEIDSKNFSWQNSAKQLLAILKI